MSFLRSAGSEQAPDKAMAEQVMSRGGRSRLNSAKGMSRTKQKASKPKSSRPKQAARSKSRLMSPEMAALSVHRGRQLVGLGVLGVAVLLAMAMLSYSPADPSLNRATGAATQNWLGAPGAIIADLLLQSVGFASVILFVVALAWAVRLLRCQSILSIGWRRATCRSRCGNDNRPHHS